MNDELSPELKELGPAIKYYGDGESDPGMVSPQNYGISGDPEIAALQAETQKVTQNNAAPARPKSERWYLSPGQKPLDRSDPALGGDTPITDAGPSPTADGKSFE